MNSYIYKSDIVTQKRKKEEEKEKLYMQHIQALCKENV